MKLKIEQENKPEEIEAIGAGDQYNVWFACNETPELMPLISLAHKLSRRLTEVRKTQLVDYLRPDGKTQVTVEYEGNKPVRVHTILISTQHSEHVDNETIRRDLIELVIKEVIPAELLDDETKIYINPTGRFVIGGSLQWYWLNRKKNNRYAVDIQDMVVEHSRKRSKKVDNLLAIKR